MSKDKSLQPTITIRTKLLTACLILLIVPIIIIGTISYQSSSKETNTLIEKNIQNNVAMALALITSFDESVKNGTLSKEEAQEKVKTALLDSKQGGIRTINKDIDLGEHGYYYVLDDQGMLLAHPKLEGQSIWDRKTSDGFYYIQDVIAKAKSGGGLTKYNWPLPNSEKEALKVVYSAYYENWGWIVSAGSYMQDYNQGLTNILKTLLITLASCFLAGLLFSYLFARHIAKPLSIVSEQTVQIAKGDLTGDFLLIKNQDELGQLGRMFSLMRQNILKLVTEISTSSDQVSQKLGALAQSTHEVTEASNHISSSVQQISLLTHTQARSVEENANAMEEMAAAIQRISETSTITLGVSESMANEADQGSLFIAETTEKMTSLHATISDLSIVIEQLNDRSQQIGSIVQVITEIANQTRLLSLNAAIESARAGEAGQGFAVVASEVRKLADRSNHSALQVSELISSIQGNITFVVTEMHRSEIEVNIGVESVIKTGEAFNRIHQATKNTVTLIQDASAASQELSAGAQQVAASLQEMKRMSENTANTTESISSYTEEQLASMENIVASADSISHLAETLQQTAHQFKIK